MQGALGSRARAAHISADVESEISLKDSNEASQQTSTVTLTGRESAERAAGGTGRSAGPFGRLADAIVIV